MGVWGKGTELFSRKVPSLPPGSVSDCPERKNPASGRTGSGAGFMGMLAYGMSTQPMLRTSSYTPSFTTMNTLYLPGTSGVTATTFSSL